MKIAVTGASGFVGKQVLQALSHLDGIDIVAASRNPDFDLTQRAGVRRVVLDITAPHGPRVFELLGEPDVLVHLAWTGLPNYGSLHHFERQLGEQFAFLRSVVQGGLRSLTCVGTCYEYGMRPGCLNESMTTDPFTPYGFAKDALRRQLEFLQRQTKVELNWARLFYMYGEGQAPSSLYAQLVSAGRRGDTCFKMSKGDQLRDFLPATEVADRLVALALRAPNSGIVNICSGEPISVRSLVERWMSEHNFNMALELGHYPYPAHEPMAFWGDAGRMHALLDRA